MGRVYKRGKIWWIQYYRRSQLFRESSRSPLKSLASALLKKREGEIIDGRFPGLQVQKVRFEELAQDYLQDYRMNGRKSLHKAQGYVRYLTEAFGGMRAVDITSDKIAAYIEKRLAMGMVNGTINRELAALKRMFNLGAHQEPPKVLRIPRIPHLKEDNIRTGFFEHDEFLALRAALPDHQKIPLTIGYWIGMRLGEILMLRWEQIDLERRVLRLEPGTTKNEKGRVVPLMGDLPDVLERWRKDTLIHWPTCPWVCHRQGKRLTRLTRAWNTACRKIGLEGKLFHDLRRTAIRNMVRAGIPERVAMMISGHKTRSVFDRYDIVSERDLHEAAARLAAHFERLTLSAQHDMMGHKKISDEHTREHNPGTADTDKFISP